MRTLHSENATRQINGQAVFQAIVNANAPVSRAELSRELGLSKQTLSEIVGLLEQSQWIRVAGHKKGALGRAATSYELNPDAGYVVGVTLEGGQYTMGLATMRGNIRAKKIIPISAKALSSSEVLTKNLLEHIDALIAEAAIDIHLIRHMVVGCPGVVDPVTMQIHHSPNLPSLQGFDLKGTLSKRFKIPVQLDNESNLHAYGEYRFGCSQQTQSSVFIGLSSDIGIGMGIMLGDQIWNGGRGWAGEIGYLPVHRSALNLEEKTRGALELSLNQSKAQYAKVPVKAGKGAAAGEAARSQAESHGELMDALAKDCAYAIASTMCILDPELVILGGSLGDDAQLHALVAKWLAVFSSNPITLRKGALGQEAGLLGAIALALQATQSMLFHAQLDPR